MPKRANEYAENPHLPGTAYAAWWDLAESLRRLGRAVLVKLLRPLQRLFRRYPTRPQ